MFLFGHIISLASDPRFSAMFGNQGVHWNLGNGERISFWDDVWIGSNLLRYRFPRLYLLSPDKSSRLLFSNTRIPERLDTALIFRCGRMQRRWSCWAFWWIFISVRRWD